MSTLFTTIIVVLAVVIILVLYYFGEVIFPQFLIYIGRFDSGWINVRQRPPEGQFYVVTEGRPEGPFCAIIESVPGYHYDKDKKVFVEGDVPPEPVYGSNAITRVGFNRALLYRETKFDRWERKPNSEEWGLKEKVHKGNAIIFQYRMATKASNLETSEKWKVNIVTTFSPRIMDPLQALFIAGSWAGEVSTAIQGVIREYTIGKSYDEILQEKAEQENDLIKMILGLNTGWISSDDKYKKALKEGRKGLVGLIGVELVTASLVEVELTADSKKERDAAAAEAIAEAKGRATIKEARAEGKAQVIRARNDNKARTIIAEGIKAEYEARDAAGDNGPAYAHAEAVREVGREMAAAIKVAKPKAIGGNFMVSLTDETSEKHDKKTVRPGK